MVGRKEREVTPSEQETVGLAQLLSSPDVYGRTTRYKGVKASSQVCKRKLMNGLSREHFITKKFQI